MLVLSRKEGEKISIGQDIEITICRIAGGRVKVGLRAPGDVRIVRSEISDHKAILQDYSPAKHLWEESYSG